MPGGRAEAHNGYFAALRPLVASDRTTVAGRSRIVADLKFGRLAAVLQKPPAVIRQRPLPPISAFLDEVRERRLTK
jgi:hypothetical protein